MKNNIKCMTLATEKYGKICMASNQQALHKSVTTHKVFRGSGMFEGIKSKMDSKFKHESNSDCKSDQLVSKGKRRSMTYLV